MHFVPSFVPSSLLPSLLPSFRRGEYFFEANNIFLMLIIFFEANNIFFEAHAPQKLFVEVFRYNQKHPVEGAGMFL